VSTRACVCVCVCAVVNFCVKRLRHLNISTHRIDPQHDSTKGKLTYAKNKKNGMHKRKYNSDTNSNEQKRTKAAPKNNDVEDGSEDSDGDGDSNSNVIKNDDDSSSNNIIDDSNEGEVETETDIAARKKVANKAKKYLKVANAIGRGAKAAAEDIAAAAEAVAIEVVLAAMKPAATAGQPGLIQTQLVCINIHARTQ
jgi:hypothetical protein